MQARARVVSVAAGRARVSCDDRSGCEACGPAGRCALRWFPGTAAGTIEVPDRGDGERPLREGDSVLLEVADGELLRAAAATYLGPLAGLLAGALLGRWLAAGAEWVAFTAGLAGALAGWAMARPLVRRGFPRVEVRRLDAHRR